MKQLIPMFLAGALLVLVTGCKSEKEKCLETTNATYERQVAACQDDACKQKAAKDKADFTEICNSK